MAIESYVGAEIDPSVASFENWLNRTNDIITDMGSVVITTGDNNVGNTAIEGVFSANTVVVNTSLRGGNTSTSGPLTISSNTVFTSNLVSLSSQTFLSSTGNVDFLGSTRTFLVDNANTTIRSLHLNIESDTTFSGDVNFTGEVTTDDLTVTGNLNVDTLELSGNTIFNQIEVANHSTLNSVTGNNAVFNSIETDHLTVNSNSSFQNITVSGNSSLSTVNASSISITGNSHFSNIHVSANASIQRLTVSGNTSLSNVAITGNTTANNVTTSSLTSPNIVATGTGAIRVPSGATIQRPSGQIGMFRFNSTDGTFEGHDGNSWSRIGDTINQISGTGYLVKTGSTSAATRTITSGSGVTVSNGSGVSANTSISADFASISEMRNATSNKVVNTQHIFAASAPVSVSIGSSSFTINMNNGVNFVFTLTGNRTMNSPQNAKPGQSGLIIVKQDSSGGRSLNFGNSWKFPGGDPLLSGNANDVDIISYYVEDSSNIYCTISRGFQ